MTDKVEQRLADNGITLPIPAAPIASYVAAVEHHGLLHISGQLPFVGSDMITGVLGDSVTIEKGQEAAKACAIMLIAQMKQALGSLDRVERIIKLGAFVASTPDFTDQPQVANGASDMMELAFGDAGKHARAAVGVSALPRGAAVEVDAIVAVKPA
jgi:enamine deaminase RidA (YjgF/YER057c/UK114 family)